MELHTQQPDCFAVNCSRNLNSISIPTYRSTCRCCLVAKYPHPFVCKHTPSVSTWLVVFSYLIVLLIFSFQHNHCISRKYQRYLICRQKSIIEVAESIKLVRLENEQKKNSLHYYKLSTKFKNALAFLLRDARHALTWQNSNAHLCNPPEAIIEVGD